MPVNSGKGSKISGAPKTGKNNVPERESSVSLMKRAIQGLPPGRFPNRVMSKTEYKTGLKKQEETL